MKNEEIEQVMEHPIIEKMEMRKLKGTEFIDEFSKEIYEQTYKYGIEDINITHKRVAHDLAKEEKDSEYWENQFLWAFEDFKFVPGGRITSNAGTGLKGTTYINCYVSGFDGEDRDSMESIMAELRRQALILKSEGGYGFCADTMRPRGGFIHGIGSESPGAVKMLDMWDTQSAVITEGSGRKILREKAKGKIRKGAQMVTFSCSSPDIEEFITAKQTPGRLTKFNMSVLVTDEFINAVENNLPWNLEFPDYTNNKEAYEKEWDGNLKLWKEKGYSVDVYKTYKNANELWELIMQSTYNKNEPGILFIDTINKLNNLYYNEYISATNPCLAGDTLVYVADGRGFVSIKELSVKGDDISVFCLNDKNKIDIRTMRNPRITGYNQPIYKVTLDDGSAFRVTKNHKFKMYDGNYCETENLKNGDSLHVSIREQGTFGEAFPGLSKNQQDYYWVKPKHDSIFKAEHRLIAEFAYNTKIETGYVVHHKNFNSLDNNSKNLEIMSFDDHVILHSINMIGDKNPMVRAQTEWSDEKWKDYSEKMSTAVSGEKNGRYSGISEDDFRKLALELTKQLERRFSLGEWMKFCENNNTKYTYTKWREKKLGTIKGLAIWAALELGFDKYLDEDPRMVENLKKWTKQGYNCRIEKGGLIYIKECEICEKEFETLKRENSICGHECNNKRTSIRNKDKSFIEKCTTSQKLQKEKYKYETREKQLKIYSDLKFDIKREPLRTEWETECKENNIAFRLGKSSPFESFTSLKEIAKEYNHKVVSVELDGYEDVYNGTVDEFHNFFLSCNTELKPNGKQLNYLINNRQCGEQLLPPGGVCLLGSINLTQFIDFENKSWNYGKLKEVIPIAVRFMDNVNDITNVPLEIQKENLKNKRRIGLGIMGYGSALMMLKIRYGSEYALKITDELMNFIANNAYQASSMLAKEKGAFILYDEQKYLAGKFIANLTSETIKLIKKHGIRNSHLLSIQPTGNSSIFANVISGGLEPVFMPTYTRTSMMPYPPEGLDTPKNIDWDNKKYDSTTNWVWIKEGDENLLKFVFEDYTWKFDKSRGLLRETVVKDYAVRFLEKNNEWDSNADWAATTVQLNIDEHVKTMGVLAKYIDSAMSKTINIPNSYPYEDFKKLYMDMYKTGTIKGGTTYRAGTMTEVLAASDKKEESGSENKITKTKAPARPKTLPCDIYHVTTEGQQWVVFVGLLDNEPYEVFAFKEKSIHLPTKLKAGHLIKIKRGRYDLDADGIIIESVAENFETGEQEALTRLISIALRHGTDIKFIVEQLNKSEGKITSFSKAIGRTLKKYIKDGDTSTEVCPNCSAKNTLVYQEGCVVCSGCAYSACS
jgi:ribonucleotide reductase alpha subunit